MKRSLLLIVLALLATPILAGLLTAPAQGATVENCLDIDIDTCDFNGLDSMCQALFSNPRPCDKVCKGLFEGTDVGTCIICCQAVKSQLNMTQPYQVEVE
jgi:hypothetical protein